jgi:hypothetical protein
VKPAALFVSEVGSACFGEIMERFPKGREPLTIRIRRLPKMLLKPAHHLSQIFVIGENIVSGTVGGTLKSLDVHPRPPRIPTRYTLGSNNTRDVLFAGIFGATLLEWRGSGTRYLWTTG